MHERVSVHSVTFHGAPLSELHECWQRLDLKTLSLTDTQLLDPELPTLTARHGYRTHAVYHLFGEGRIPVAPADVRGARDALDRVVDAAAAVDARMIYLLTGGRGPLNWRDAAEAFCAAVAPSRARAREAGVKVAIENASSLYADIHIAHSLRDTSTLAQMGDLGICLDVFHCWAEADLPTLVQRALPRVCLIQLSDYVLGDRALPARAVPGDGAIPLQPLISQVIGAGYSHGFDLELIGPRIDREGREAAARRACTVVSDMLTRAGA
ncbi:sugar phosphate isomerase/epimerase family protein [Mycobacterium sp. ZZG]